jgi:hypothetical protein
MMTLHFPCTIMRVDPIRKSVWNSFLIFSRILARRPDSNCSNSSTLNKTFWRVLHLGAYDVRFFLFSATSGLTLNVFATTFYENKSARPPQSALCCLTSGFAANSLALRVACMSLTITTLNADHHHPKPTFAPSIWQGPRHHCSSLRQWPNQPFPLTFNQLYRRARKDCPWVKTSKPPPITHLRPLRTDQGRTTTVLYLPHLGSTRHSHHTLGIRSMIRTRSTLSDPTRPSCHHSCIRT